MKTKKILTISVVAVLLIAIVSIAVYAVFNNTGIINPEEETLPKAQEKIITKINYPEDQIRADAEPEKAYTTLENNIENLTYAYTDNRVLTSNSDVYVDSSGSEYFFTADAKLSGYRSRVPRNVDSDEALTQDEITALSVKYAVSLLADRFDGFVLDSVSYIESSSKYHLAYERKYGEGDFATGERLDITIYSNGYLYSCFLRNSAEMEGFDKALLDGITQEYLEERVEEEAAELFPDLKELWIDEISIVKRDGKFVLEVDYNHITESAPSGEMQKEYNINMLMTPDRYEFVMSYYFPLED